MLIPFEGGDPVDKGVSAVSENIQVFIPEKQPEGFFNQYQIVGNRLELASYWKRDGRFIGKFIVSTAVWPIAHTHDHNGMNHKIIVEINSPKGKKRLIIHREDLSRPQAIKRIFLSAGQTIYHIGAFIEFLREL